MDKDQPSQYAIPIELLNTFQIQWSAYKSLQEYMELVKKHEELAELGQNPQFGQALYEVGELLGQDLSRSLAAILNAAGETVRRRSPAGS